MDSKDAIWDDDLVDKLNAYQMKIDQHPYTCPGIFPECRNHRELIATSQGWICQCEKYSQSFY